MHSVRMEVPQKLMYAVLISLVHPRPCLITTNSHLRTTELLIEKILGSFLQNFDPNECVMLCHKYLTYPLLQSRFSMCDSSALLLRRVDQMPASVQLHLGHALMQPDPILSKFIESSALIFTLDGPLENLHPFLRRQILFKQDIRLIDEDLVRLLPPSAQQTSDIEKSLVQIRDSIPKITVVPELLRYIQDIIIYIRTHRFVRVGLRPQASSDFELLLRTLCVLKGSNFANPVMIKEAARLALPVHVQLCEPEDEPSLQYGSDIEVVREYMQEWDSDVLVDSALEQVPVPK